MAPDSELSESGNSFRTVVGVHKQNKKKIHVLYLVRGNIVFRYFMTLY